MIPSDSTARGTFRTYYRVIAGTKAAGQAAKHSYRPALQTLIERLGGDAVCAVNEPWHVARGALDFVVARSGLPIGHIE